MLIAFSAIELFRWSITIFNFYICLKCVSLVNGLSRPYCLDDFDPNQSSTDDEETIAKEEEENSENHNHSEEIELLKRESELPLEDLLKALPEDYLDNREKSDICDNSASEKASNFYILLLLP